jgi:hypothetical protein
MSSIVTQSAQETHYKVKDYLGERGVNGRQIIKMYFKEAVAMNAPGSDITQQGHSWTRDGAYNYIKGGKLVDCQRTKQGSVSWDRDIS